MVHLKILWSHISAAEGLGNRRIAACLIGTLALVVLGSALSAAAPLALKNLVDALPRATVAERVPAPPSLFLAAALYVILLCGGRLLADVRPLLSGIVEQRMQAILRQRFFDHVLDLPIGYLLRQRPGDLIHSLDLGASGMQSVFTHGIHSVAPALIELALMIVVLAQLGSPSLMVLFAVASILYLAVFALGATRLTPYARGVSTASMDVYAGLNSGVASVETLRCFTAEAQARSAVAETNAALEARWLAYSRRSVGISVAISAVFTASFASCLVVAAHAVDRGQLTIGGFVLTLVYMLQMVRPLEVLGSAARDFARASAFLQPLGELLAQPSEHPSRKLSGSSPPTAAAASTAPTVRVVNLRFGYDPERPVIKGMNLEIQPGRTIAIVGRSGSGKSSLARLLMRLILPQAGHILLNGTPIETLTAEHLRASIGLVPQDTSLLHASIADNIALGMPEATPEDIERAARAAQLHELIDSLPRGYDTLVGERGLQLSGGERQRVAIARALLRRPTLFVLDEPTSMLDSKTEASIQIALREATAGTTTIVIAHRLSTIMAADEIVVLDDGQVQEQGRHLELLAKGGLYADLWRQQSGGTA